jgi:hypothetical protein
VKRGCNRGGAVLRSGLAAALLALPSFGTLAVRPESPPPVPASGCAAAVEELRALHGIRVTGAYDAQDLAHALVAARLFLATETEGLTFDFARERLAYGRLGEWRETGVASIASRRLDTVIHETAHHVLEHRDNTRARLVDQLLDRAVRDVSGTALESCVTRPYALDRRHDRDHGELHAELVTALALERLGYATAGTVQNPRFLPPAPVRELVGALFRSE